MRHVLRHVRSLLCVAALSALPWFWVGESRATMILGDACLSGNGCPQACQPIPDEPAMSWQVVGTPLSTCQWVSGDWECDSHGWVKCGTWQVWAGVFCDPAKGDMLMDYGDDNSEYCP
jgi:hypothetical protein